MGEGEVRRQKAEVRKKEGGARRAAIYGGWDGRGELRVFKVFRVIKVFNDFKDPTNRISDC